MIIHPSSARGVTKLDWLDSKHSFSFGDWHNPSRMGWGSLRVLNDDIISPGKGFGMHPHREMEIITIMLRGSLAHEDSAGNKGVLAPGDVQHMSAGTGIRHSEFNASDSEEAHLLQLWILPKSIGGKPSYAQRTIPLARNTFVPLVTPDGADETLRIGADARIMRAMLDAGTRISRSSAQHTYLYVIAGRIDINGRQLADGDAAAFSPDENIHLGAIDACDLLLVETTEQR
jgi:redox-sensitive bicupin YhaK (pirin superfamily)